MPAVLPAIYRQFRSPCLDDIGGLFKVERHFDDLRPARDSSSASSSFGIRARYSLMGYRER